MAGYSRKRKIDRIEFLSDHVMALKEAIPTDIVVKPGDNGQGIPTHRAVLAVKSKVFRNMLDSDECKVSPEESITIPDMSYDELKSFIEFFYSGVLSPHNQHVRALYLAAHKYDIQYLQDISRDILISSLSSDNVFDILELPPIPSDTILKKAAIAFAASHVYTTIDSKRYESFADKNPRLSVEVARACVDRLKLYEILYVLQNEPLQLFG